MGTYGVGSSNSPIVIDDSSDDDSVDARQVAEELELMAGSGSGVSRTPSVIALNDLEPEVVEAKTDLARITNGIGGEYQVQDVGDGDSENDGGDQDKDVDWEQEDEDEDIDEAEPESGDEDLADFMEKWMEEDEDSERTWMTVKNGGYRILARKGYQPGMGLGPRLEGAFCVVRSFILSFFLVFLSFYSREFRS